MNPPDLAVSRSEPEKSPVGATAVSPAVRVVRHGRAHDNDTTAHHPDHPAAAAPLGPARPPQPTRRRTTPMLVQLDREWARLRRRATAIRTVRGWDGDTTFRDAVQTVSDLDELVAATQPRVGPPGSGDAILRRLVELAAADELAGRIVLQRLLPGLISQSRRWMQPGTRDRRERHRDRRGVDGDPGLRRRGLGRDTSRRRWSPMRCGSGSGAAPAAEWHRRFPSRAACSGRSRHRRTSPTRSSRWPARCRAAARAGVRASDLDLLRTIVVSGGPTRAARDCEVTVRTIRNRRDHAAARVRRALGPEWADWTDPLVAA